MRCRPCPFILIVSGCHICVKCSYTSDVNKDTPCKAKAKDTSRKHKDKAKDLSRKDKAKAKEPRTYIARPRTKDKDITHKAKVKDRLHEPTLSSRNPNPKSLE